MNITHKWSGIAVGRVYYQLCVLLIICIANIASAAYDTELATSLKCVSLFRHNEYKYRIPGDTLYSISLQETGRIHSTKKVKLVWPWTVNVEGTGYFFDTKREAINFVRKEITKGASSIDVGCMQVNLKHHPDAFQSLEEAFEPRANIAYGAKFLRSKYDQLGHWHKAIAHYHSATEALGKKYKDKVIKIASDINKYKDPFYRNINNHRSNKERNSTMGRGGRQNFANAGMKQKRYRSNMMVHVPKHSNTY